MSAISVAATDPPAPATACSREEHTAKPPSGIECWSSSDPPKGLGTLCTPKRMPVCQALLSDTRSGPTRYHSGLGEENAGSGKPTPVGNGTDATGPRQAQTTARCAQLARSPVEGFAAHIGDSIERDLDSAHEWTAIGSNDDRDAPRSRSFPGRRLEGAPRRGCAARILAAASSRGVSPGGTGGRPAALEAMRAKCMIGEVNCDAEAIQE